MKLDDAAATAALGARIAALTEPGDVIVLAGPLGAGKTTLAQGFARALGITGAVRSPTYTLVDVHEGGRLPLLHMDAWRLEDSTEVEGLGLDEAPAGAVLLIEWGEQIAPVVSDPARGWLVIRLDRPGQGTDATALLACPRPPAGADVRTAELEPHGGTWAQRLAG